MDRHTDDTNTEQTHSRRSVLGAAGTLMAAGNIVLGDPISSDNAEEHRRKYSSTNSEEESEPGNGGDGPLTNGAFLFEGFENREYNMVEMPEDTGGYVPNHPEAVTLSDYARVGDTSFRLRVDYGWEYHDRIRRGSNKPIPDNRSLMASKGYSQWDTPFWFAFSLGLDENWSPDSHIEQVQECHRDLSKNSGDTHEERKASSGSKPGKPVSTQIDGRTLQFRNDWTENGEERNQITEAPEPLEAGNWYDIVYNINWTNELNSDGDGFLRVWVDGEQVVDHTGNTVARDIAPPRPPELRIYKWIWNQSDITPDNTQRTYYFDEVRYGWGDAEYSDMAPGARDGKSGESVYPSWWPDGPNA